MTKDEFLRELNDRLKGYPDKDDIVSFYYEQISDRLEAGETEDEIFREIRIDDVVAGIREKTVNAEFVGEAPYGRKEESFFTGTESKDKPQAVVVEKKEEPKTEARPQAQGTLSGWRKFWYVVWCIACVFFCIAAVCIEIQAISLGIAAGVCFIVGAVSFIESVGMGVILIGVGLVVLGLCIIATHFAKVLVRYVFGNRRSWTQSVRNNLGGNK